MAKCRTRPPMGRRAGRRLVWHNCARSTPRAKSPASACTTPRRAASPFADWIYGELLAWLAAERIPLWISLADTPVAEVMETLRRFPDLQVVLLGAHYVHTLALRPLLRALPQAAMELSRFENIGGHRVPDRRILAWSASSTAPIIRATPWGQCFFTCTTWPLTTTRSRL